MFNCLLLFFVPPPPPLPPLEKSHHLLDQLVQCMGHLLWPHGKWDNVFLLFSSIASSEVELDGLQSVGGHPRLHAGTTGRGRQCAAALVWWGGQWLHLQWWCCWSCFPSRYACNGCTAHAPLPWLAGNSPHRQGNQADCSSPALVTCSLPMELLTSYIVITSPGTLNKCHVTLEGYWHMHNLPCGEAESEHLTQLLRRQFMAIVNPNVCARVCACVCRYM